MIHRVFVVLNMTCAHCAMNIDGAVEDLPGVHSCDTSYARGRATVAFDPERVSAEEIVAAIGAAGYGARLAADDP